MSTDAPFADGGASAFASLTELFADAGLDSIWLDLDGDLVPDTEISSYEPGSAADPFAIPEQSKALSTASGDDVESALEDDGSGYDSWISIETTDDSGWPLYDVIDLIPELSMPYTDWTTPGAYGYDPMQMSNFSVDAGPVIIDPASGQPCCATDYSDASLWFNDSAFDSGAGYWDPTYAVMPTSPDLSMWQSAPDSYTVPSLDMANDPFSLTSWSTPDTGYAFDASSAYPSAYDTSSFSTSYTTPTYDSTDYTSWSSSWDSSPTDVSTSYFTDYTFDDQLDAASSNSQYWMDEYDSASDLSWDFWQASVDASTAGDSSLAYDYNQLSLQSQSYADSAWDASSTAWDSSFSSTSSYSADDGWYDAMSLDY